MCHLCITDQKPVLRTVCAPDDATATEHTHKCRQCGTSWRHDDSLKRNQAITQEEFDEAHSCPNCGREQRIIHKHSLCGKEDSTASSASWILIFGD
jgi:hypothetical protein